MVSKDIESKHRTFSCDSTPRAGRECSAHQPRIGHFTTVDQSLYFLLRTELEEAIAEGYSVFGLSAPGPGSQNWNDSGFVTFRSKASPERGSPGPICVRRWNFASALKDLDLDVLHTHTPKAGVLGRDRWAILSCSDNREYLPWTASFAVRIAGPSDSA